MASGAELIRKAKEQIREVDPREVHDLLGSNATATVIVDVREQQEFEESHIPGAVHVPRGHLESRIEGAARTSPGAWSSTARPATAPRWPPRRSRRSWATRTSSR